MQGLNGRHFTPFWACLQKKSGAVEPISALSAEVGAPMRLKPTVNLVDTA
jgi:hypothetical protein